jgi:hypothetical protein
MFMFPSEPAKAGWWFDWPPGLVSRQRLLGFSEALICLSYPGITGLPSRSSESEGWLSRAVMLRGLPLIRRVLCF